MNHSQQPVGHDLIETEMIEVALEFWLKDQEEIRSPFPEYIKHQLPELAIASYMQWVSKLRPEAKKELSEEILVEKFEECLFESAMNLVLTEDEKLTIQYPFMLRIGDLVEKGEHERSEVTDRKVVKGKDQSLFEVTLKEIETGKVWKTAFELPE